MGDSLLTGRQWVARADVESSGAPPIRSTCLQRRT
jgi:hypothetical protein